MIEKLQNNNIEIAKKIFSVFQISYKVEAELLKAIDFPPLKRPLEKYINTNTAFYGFFKSQKLAGVVEISSNDKFTHINSLVVHPDFFRQGIGRKLMEYVLHAFDSNLFVVETGLENVPAIKLYEGFGFKEVKQWDTDHGVRKVKFERRMDR
ncbi:MAG: ribosomal protein S18 acetylase RimI-like enzyme [Polaribacter sp.]|jgi:ribosomal protein S18 acetylase RimI-like enzyme